MREQRKQSESPAALRARRELKTTRRGFICAYASENCSFAPRSTGTIGMQIPFSARKIRTRRELGEPVD
jgi:hypothetical protein